MTYATLLAWTLYGGAAICLAGAIAEADDKRNAAVFARLSAFLFALRQPDRRRLPLHMPVPHTSRPGDPMTAKRPPMTTIPQAAIDAVYAVRFPSDSTYFRATPDRFTKRVREQRRRLIVKDLEAAWPVLTGEIADRVEARGESVYPRDIFISPTSEQYAEINALLKAERGHMLDGISGDVMRRAHAGIASELRLDGLDGYAS